MTLTGQAIDPTPMLGKVSFACPHSNCRTLAHQTWYSPYGVRYAQSNNPSPVDVDSLYVIVHGDKDAGSKILFNAQITKMINGEMFFNGDSSAFVGIKIANLFVSSCEACKKLAVWKNNKILWLALRADVPPHPDMPTAILADYEEAATIVDVSPRGACALLRFCVQKLCIELGYPGKDLNSDIGKMVAEKGLSVGVQQALDIVRVIGNSAVHPLEMFGPGDKDTALMLFEILNNIVDRVIAEPLRMEKIYSHLPPGKREQIVRRDAPKAT